VKIKQIVPLSTRTTTMVAVCILLIAIFTPPVSVATPLTYISPLVVVSVATPLTYISPLVVVVVAT
jgi:hypothetical protein